MSPSRQDQRLQRRWRVWGFKRDRVASHASTSQPKEQGTRDLGDLFEEGLRKERERMIALIKEAYHHDFRFYGKKGFERESTRIGDFIPAGPVPLFPQGCPFIPAGLSLYSRRAVLLFPQGWRSSPWRHLAPARPAPTAMAGIRAGRHPGPRR